jgi:hypothetical protein
MSDTTSTWTVKDGLAQSHPAAILLDQFGNVIPQVAIRSGGAPVAAGNPLPVGDAALLAAVQALGTEEAGFATAAGQATGNASLATIATATATQATAAGQASSLTQQTAVAAGMGTPADAAWSSGAGTLVGLLKGLFGLLSGTLKVSQVSSAGIDASGSAATVGNLLATAQVTMPGHYRFQNQSAATLQLIFDDAGGTVTPTVFLIGPGVSANTQGGGSDPEMPWFVGRIRVAGPANSQFALRCN